MNQNILDFFKKAIEFNNLAHAYLFYGPRGSGKKDTAFWLSEYLKVSPFDILYVVPEQDKKDISINQIRQAKRHLTLSSDSYRFVIIDNADLMNIESSNALLKTLEEPQEKTVLILITTTPDLLPKTILSRLQDVKFKDIPLSKMSFNKKYVDILKESTNDIFKFIESFIKEDLDIFSLLDSWLFYFRDLMLKDKKYLQNIKEIQKTKDLISSSNVNKRLALENLILCIKN
ncbi:MAG: AAA family ATPase [Patescibacteria group bacterium]